MSKQCSNFRPMNAAWKPATDLNDEEQLEKEEAQFEEELKDV